MQELENIKKTSSNLFNGNPGDLTYDYEILGEKTGILKIYSMEQLK